MLTAFWANNRADQPLFKAVSSEEFLSLYLEEIGVDVSALAPVSLPESLKAAATAPLSTFSKSEPQTSPSVQTQVYKPVELVEAPVVEAPVAEAVDLIDAQSADLTPYQAEPSEESFREQTPEPIQPQVFEPVAEAAYSAPQALSPQVIAPQVISPQAPAEHIAADSSSLDDSSLSGLQAQAEACRACELHDSRNKLVFGSGNPQADLIFIGDAPGREEDLTGMPLAGRSGELFNRMLASIGLSRDSVYIMNGVKCRPLHSRDPKPEEFAACERWLTAQIEMVQPKMICMLGRVVAESLLNTTASLSELRAGHHHFRGIPVQVIDHPSYLLRSQKHKQRAWDDLNRLKKQYLKYQSA